MQVKNSSGLVRKSGSPNLIDPDNHRPARIERQIVEAETGVELPDGLIDWMGQDRENADALGCGSGRFESKAQQGGCMSLTLMRFADGQLAKQGGWDWIRPVALLRFWQ